MTLFEDIGNRFGRAYLAMAKCSNCQAVQEVRVPRGETIEEYFKSSRGICNVCKCATLEKYKKPEVTERDKLKDGWKWQ